MLDANPSGFYAWCAIPESKRAVEGRRLLSHIGQSRLESGAVYGYRKVSDDLRDLGEQCSIKRVHRIMRDSPIIQTLTGYAIIALTAHRICSRSHS